ncbi:hypothetical protein PDO_1396 [Rhizobium sp. PDO1-076]|uniref:hypothetical protein n=1 Tax=Rhizobium sp. PDO1-076 TaxID=1125979 RepID=UPI00024E3C61|nr:hypothetical protein [Rhizobium sp. PDO1-076]EHS52636.1 hypothetical protein PDO_1396 [Rhizobium sp. PDO1-076]
MELQVVEYGGVPVGIAVPHENRLRFIAVKFHVIELDNRLYESPAELRAAIGRHVVNGSGLAA